MKRQGIQRIILFIVELFANIKGCGFYIKPSSKKLICDTLSSELHSIFLILIQFD